MVGVPLELGFNFMLKMSRTISDFALRFRRTTLIVFLMITGFFLIMNLPQFTVRKAILDRTLLSGNQTRINNEYVWEKLGWEEFFGFGVGFKNGINNVNDLKKIQYIHEKLEKEFEGDVVSLANYPLQRGTGGSKGKVVSGFGIPENLQGLDVKELKEVISQTQDIFGILVERDWKRAYFIINLDAGYDEYDFFFRIKEIFEEREMKWYHRYIETDIHPKDSAILIGSWITSRTAIFQTLYINMILVILVGFAMSWYFSKLFTQSNAQATFMACVYLVSIIWTRGSIGLLHWMGFPIYERVFILATFTANIVQGLSFGVHKIEEFNRTGNWKKAQKVDRLILFTAFVVIYGFMTLLSFKDNSIREMGIASAIGIFHIYCLTIFFMPALARFRPATPTETRIGARVNQFILWLAKGCIRASMVPAKYYVRGLGVMVFVTIVLICTGGMRFGSTPFSYIEGKQSEKSARKLNLPGNIGADALHLIIEPSNLRDGDSGRVKESEFLMTVMRLQDIIEKDDWGAWRSFSIINIIR